MEIVDIDSGAGGVAPISHASPDSVRRRRAQRNQRASNEIVVLDDDDILPVPAPLSAFAVGEAAVVILSDDEQSAPPAAHKNVGPGGDAHSRSCSGKKAGRVHLGSGECSLDRFGAVREVAPQSAARFAAIVDGGVCTDIVVRGEQTGTGICQSEQNMNRSPNASCHDATRKRRKIVDVEKGTSDGSAGIATGEDGMFRCVGCSQEIPLESTMQLSCSHRTCIPCLQRQHGSQGQNGGSGTLGHCSTSRGKCHQCGARLGESELKMFLPSEMVVEVMDIMLLNMLASDTRFVRCPKPGCGNAIERAAPSGVLPTQAPDGRSLSHEHAVHMQENRFRCAACATNFCAQCSQFPYHLAKTCTEFAIEKAKIPCRFCELPLPKSRSNQRCCTSKECKDRLRNSCEERNKCGHACLGIFGEASCPPCLTCANEDDDFCNICWTEALKAAPCARLKCGHSFHLHCLQKRLEKRWPTARISFAFANCPLCQQRVDHPSLLGAIRVVRALEKKVRDAALERYRAEGLDKAADKSEVVASSSANGKAAASAVPDENALAAAAMRRYNFYQCGKCSRPYFGGAAACGAVEQQQNEQNLDEGGGDAKSELMCGACSAKACGWTGASCKKHGDQYVEFKCRFCCSIASFFCFGNTHFCEVCHKKWAQGAYRKAQSLVAACKCGTQHSRNSTTQEGEHCFGCSLCRLKQKEAAPV